MSKLIVIGNGFDLAHDMKTKYWHFRDFIEKKHPEILEILEHYSLKDKDTLWNDFENNLSKIDIDRLRDNSLLATKRGSSDDDYYSGEDDGVEYYLNNEIGFIYQWSDLILEWVSDYIDLPDDKVFTEILINDKNYFLSFNYTETLEYTYGIYDERVIHIHGRAGYVQDLIMGHRDEQLLKYVEDNQVDYAFNQKESSLMKSVLKYLKASYKDVISIIQSWMSYLDNYRDVDEVHIIGWSISEIDLPYFDEILQIVSKKTPIIIYYYNNEAKIKFEEKLSDYINKNTIVFLNMDDIKINK